MRPTVPRFAPRIAVLVLAVLVLAVLLAGCSQAAPDATTDTASDTTPDAASPDRATAPAADDGADTSETDAPAPPRPVFAEVLRIEGFAYHPDDLLAGADRELVIANLDGVAHTVTAWDNSFDVRVEAGQEVVLRLPAEPGAYPYACTLHPSMRGEIDVL